MFVFCVFCFDNQFRNYISHKPSFVPHVSLKIRYLENLRDYYLQANYIKILQDD